MRDSTESLIIAARNVDGTKTEGKSPAVVKKQIREQKQMREMPSKQRHIGAKFSVNFPVHSLSYHIKPPFIYLYENENRNCTSSNWSIR